MKKLLIIILFLTPILLISQENCNNGIDDDGDGLIDLFDDECECEGFSSSQNVPSLIPNYSFENNTGCGGVSQLGHAVTWIQASNPTSDYWNSCGGGPTFSPHPQYPLPGGGDGFVGFYNNSGWQEHIGACLSSPMVAGNTYILSCWVAGSGFGSSYSLPFSIYGTPNCADLPFNSNGCPVGINGWYEMGNTQLNLPTDNSWVNVTFTFTPTQNINAIDFGGSCANPNGGYFYLDELLLSEISNFSSIEITPNGGWCTDDLSLTASTDTSGGTWQWYKDSIALVGETNPILNISGNNYGLGNYTIKLTIGNKCETTTYSVELPDFPTANFDFDSVCNNNVTSFNDLSTVPSGTINTWEWDFGDGNISNNTSPTHTFSNDGSFNVQLIVTSDIGCKDTLTETVLVFPNPQTNFTVEDVCLNEPSIFMNTSSINAPDNIATYNWTFGDGNSSTLANPNHIYANEGTFQVKLVLASN
ncbi:MAG: PKD domain-containing protein, partial [Flavobacteriales bacterium]|nr:PKD domain-containing protein [Flavobacteriales bacterium]